MKVPSALLLVLSACASQAPLPPQGASTPAAPESAPDPKQHLREERATATIERLAAKNFAGSREWFDEQMRTHVSEDLLRDTWSRAEIQFGSYKTYSHAPAARENGAFVLTFDLLFDKGHLTARIIFDSDERIAGLFLKPAGG